MPSPALFRRSPRPLWRLRPWKRRGLSFHPSELRPSEVPQTNLLGGGGGSRGGGGPLRGPALPLLGALVLALLVAGLWPRPARSTLHVFNPGAQAWQVALSAGGHQAGRTLAPREVWTLSLPPGPVELRVRRPSPSGEPVSSGKPGQSGGASQTRETVSRVQAPPGEATVQLDSGGAAHLAEGAPALGEPQP